MEYVLEEFSRTKKNLDIILSSGNIEIPELTTPAEALGAASENLDEAQTQMRQPSEDESTVQNPLTIKNKGRLEKPKRWKAMIKQEREKAKKSQ
jgi:hypothetical protein